ncbi:hypothetical protein [Anabaena sp. CS-542/02]|nr:hypothetical protein [Anabaena sp. CS-542/02]MDB9446455.1 hypothetical protein [Anabaena sp. CS-542/02]
MSQEKNRCDLLAAGLARYACSSVGAIAFGIGYTQPHQPRARG